MLPSLMAPLTGIVALLLYSLNTIVCSLLLFIAALLHLFPIPTWQRFCHNIMHKAPVYWADGNNFIERMTAKTEWDIQGTEQLKVNDWYLLICNHQSWADILVLERVFNRKIPMLKFFIKKELLWTLPLAGFAAWLIDFPFMERYSKSFLAKHPELKGKDIETTRKSCEKFKNIPTALISFAEGTRFTKEKHAHQASPYRNLLRPKAGGIAFTLNAMNNSLHTLLNVTIIYPKTTPNMWDYFCGRIKKIAVRVEALPISNDLIGDYENDRAFRVYFQQWINGVWEKKDQLIDNVIKENNYGK